MSTHLKLMLAAALLTALNCVKPLHVDDAAYFYYAKHIAQNPADPYGFQIFWGQRPVPANEVLAPPLLLYWWAAVLRLNGAQPWFWKLSLLPVALLLVYTLYYLFRRFAGSLEVPLVWMITLSPVFLPSFNLMLDIPALALSLCAFVLFIISCDRNALALAALAGVIAGLAILTKWTGLLGLFVILLYAVLVRRVRLWVLFTCSAMFVFVAWEWFVSMQYGESHFLLQLSKGGRQRFVELAGGLLLIVGGTSPAIGLLGLVALGVPRRWLLSAIPFVLFGYAAIAAVPSQFSRATILFVFGLFGLLVHGTTAVAIVRLGQLSYTRKVNRLRACFTADIAVWFLALWLTAEVVGYFVLSPFPAVRRVMSLVVVSALIIGRLTAARRSEQIARSAQVCIGLGIVLGLGYCILDLRDAFTQKNAAERAASWAREQDPDAVIWYIGHWGFQFYAEQLGLRAVVPDASLLRKDDFLVTVTPNYPQRIYIDKDEATLVKRIDIRDALPFRILPSYYAGTMPLQPCHGSRVSISIYRYIIDSVPASP